MLLKWILYFFVYSFFGWCFETALDSIEQKRFINRGFLRGPVIPIYGFGAITMIIAARPVMHSPTLVFICGALSATLLEYATGYLLEFFFKTRYWDYSDCHYNIKGRICAEATLMWGFMTLFVNYNVHTHIEKIISRMDNTMLITLTIILIIIFITDTIVSFMAAVDVNTILKRLEEIKRESSVLTEKLKQHTESSYVSKIKERLDRLTAEKKSTSDKIGIFKKDYIRSNHNARSVKFNISFSELKDKIKQHSKKL
ncbi:MAG: putative ABC transporter permease [Porcipelethomonas sp.]